MLPPAVGGRERGRPARRAGATPVTSALGAENGWGCSRTGPAAGVASERHCQCCRGRAIATLYAAGARQFLVWNVPDIGLTPAVAILDAQLPGTAALATLMTQVFNALLSTALAALLPLPGITIVPFDAFAPVSAVHATPGQFGLTKVTDACLTPHVPPFACRIPTSSSSGTAFIRHTRCTPSSPHRWPRCSRGELPIAGQTWWSADDLEGPAGQMG
jgi:hypothetical protein